MRTRDLMSSPAVTVRADTAVKEAMRLLDEHGFTALPVVDENDVLLGIVTEADLMRGRVLADPRVRLWDAAADVPSTSEAGTVGEVMSRDVVRAAIGADLAEVAATMLRGHLRTLPVVDGDTVVGVITRRDLLRALARPDEAIATEVRRQLSGYGGMQRWSVTVLDGAVTIVDEFGDDADRHVALVLAQGVPGVQAVTVRSGVDTPG